MAYITNVNIEERLGTDTYLQLADDDGNGVADAAVVDEARLGAEGEVNSHLARRYEVPIDLVAHPELAELLATMTLDLAEYRLRARRPPVPEDARRRRGDTVAWLSGVAAGSIDLPSTVPVAPTTARGPAAQVSGEERLLTRDELSGH